MQTITLQFHVKICDDNGNINNLRLLKSETWLVDRPNNETKNETKPLINLITNHHYSRAGKVQEHKVHI